MPRRPIPWHALRPSLRPDRPEVHGGLLCPGSGCRRLKVFEAFIRGDVQCGE